MINTGDLVLISDQGETVLSEVTHERNALVLRGPGMAAAAGEFLASHAAHFDALFSAVVWVGEFPRPPSPPVYITPEESLPEDVKAALQGPELLRWLPVARGGRVGPVQSLSDPGKLSDWTSLLLPLSDLFERTPSPNMELIAPARKALIFNADDFGLARATNKAVIKALTEGMATSATIMMPTPFASEAAQWAASNPDSDVGVHLTFTNEWVSHNWGPVAGRDKVPSLVDHRGFMHKNTGEFERHADPEHIAVEARAQIEAALELGVRINHLDAHMGWYHLHGPSLNVVLDLAEEYKLPIRWPNPMAVKPARARGIKCVDFLDWELYGVEINERKQYILDRIDNIPEGISEIVVHPALAGDEMKAITDSWSRRNADFELMFDHDIRARLDELGIRLVGYNVFFPKPGV